MTKQSVNVASR